MTICLHITAGTVQCKTSKSAQGLRIPPLYLDLRCILHERMPRPCPALWACHRALGSSRQTGFRPQRPGPSSLSEWPAPCLSEPVRKPSAMVVLVRADAPLRVTIAGARRGVRTAPNAAAPLKKEKRGPPVPHRNRKILRVLRGRVLALCAAGRTTPLSA